MPVTTVTKSYRAASDSWPVTTATNKFLVFANKEKFITTSYPRAASNRGTACHWATSTTSTAPSTNRKPGNIATKRKAAKSSEHPGSKADIATSYKRKFKK